MEIKVGTLPDALRIQLVGNLQEKGKDELSEALLRSDIECSVYSVDSVISESVSSYPSPYSDNDCIELPLRPSRAEHSIAPRSFFGTVAVFVEGLIDSIFNQNPRQDQVDNPEQNPVFDSTHKQKHNTNDKDTSNEYLQQSFGFNNGPFDSREVVVLTIKGSKKDISRLQGNCEDIKKEMQYLFNCYGMKIDIEKCIFTLGEVPNKSSGQEVNTMRVSYDIIYAERVLDDLISVGESICANATYNGSSHENAINDYVRDMLKAKGYYEVKDQTRHGVSQKGKCAGAVDILLAKGNKEIAIIEGLKLRKVDSTYIDDHIEKSIINYNPLGTATFIIAYVTTWYFGAFWNRLYEHVKQYSFPESIEVKKDFEEILQPNAATRIAKVMLAKDGYDFPMYLVALNISLD